MEFLLKLEKLLEDRKINLPGNSYTATLFKLGVDRILKKIAEESGEVLIAAKNDSREEIIHEVADLIFHLQVLLVYKNISIQEIIEKLESRHSST